MLFDPKWSIDVMSRQSLLKSLVAWLELQPADIEYNWGDCDGRCLIGQWANAVGLGWDNIHKADGGPDGMNIYLRLVGRPSIALSGKHTFGAALERARSALALHQL